MGKNLSQRELEILKVFLTLTERRGEGFYFAYRSFDGKKEELKPLFKHLRELGYIEYRRGLMTEEGEVAGSGHGIPYGKVDVVRSILKEASIA